MHYHLDQFFPFLQEELVCLLVCIPSIQWIGHEDSMHACLHSCLFSILLPSFNNEYVYKTQQKENLQLFTPFSSTRYISTLHLFISNDNLLVHYQNYADIYTIIHTLFLFSSAFMRMPLVVLSGLASSMYFCLAYHLSITHHQKLLALFTLYSSGTLVKKEKYKKKLLARNFFLCFFPFQITFEKKTFFPFSFYFSTFLV